MSTVLTIMFVAILVAIMFGTIACDEVRRLDRRIRDLEAALRAVGHHTEGEWAA